MASITTSAATAATAAVAGAAPPPPPPLSAEVSASVRSFFAATSEPAGHAALRRALHAFLGAVPAGSRVAAVSSGGTTVPLEVNTVRFVDNFSSGARGAATAEHLLAAGYFVVFLHRTGSTLPFVRRVAWLLAQQQQEQQRTAEAAAAGAGCVSPPPAVPSSATSLNSFAFLRALNIERSSTDADTPARVSLELGGSAALAQHTSRVLESVAEYQQRLAARLLPLEFTSVADYMYALRTLCTGMRDMPPAAPTADAAAAASSAAATATAAAASQRRCMLVLAAAVSDYHIPTNVMSVHKLQSRSGPLELRMEQTPKLLYALRHPLAPATATAASSDAVAAAASDQDDDCAAWYPHGYCVSFKLETDSSLLVRKSRAALRAYRVNLVCANQLHTRYQRLQLIQLPEAERQAQAGGAPASAPAAPVDDNDGVETVLRDPAPAPGAPAQHEFDVEIERQMVQRLVDHHDAWINQQ